MKKKPEISPIINEGWISLHRKFKKWEWYTDGNTMRLFIHLLLSANHKKNNWQGISVDRGEVITGRKSLSKETGISERSIRTSLNRLKSTNEVTIKTTSRFSIISICNYGLYQDMGAKNDQANDYTSDQQVTSKRPANDQQVTTNNNDNKENNDNNKKELGAKSIQFSQEAKDICNVFTKTLDNKNMHPKNLKEKISWLKAIEECKSIDGYSFEQILDVVEYFREDAFWNTNFLSPLKLRRKNKEGIKFVDFFYEKMANGNNNGKNDEQIKARKHNMKVLKELGRTDQEIKKIMGDT